MDWEVLIGILLGISVFPGIGIFMLWYLDYGFPVSWGCKHEWETIVEKQFGSRQEYATSLGKHSSEYHSMVRKHVLITSCSKCGKIKRFVTKF